MTKPLNLYYLPFTRGGSPINSNKSQISNFLYAIKTSCAWSLRIWKIKRKSCVYRKVLRENSGYGELNIFPDTDDHWIIEGDFFHQRYFGADSNFQFFQIRSLYWNINWNQSATDHLQGEGAKNICPGYYKTDKVTLDGINKRPDKK